MDLGDSSHLCKFYEQVHYFFLLYYSVFIEKHQQHFGDT